MSITESWPSNWMTVTRVTFCQVGNAKILLRPHFSRPCAADAMQWTIAGIPTLMPMNDWRKLFSPSTSVWTGCGPKLP